VTPPELARLVEAVRGCEEALGDGKKIVMAEEEELRSFAQRAVQATRDIFKGETLHLGTNIAILRPGKQSKGLHPRFLEKIDGKKAARFVRSGRGVRSGDVAK
jgi:N-acetylneuraminate synthase